YWESQGYGGMDGVGWYRLAFDLSSAGAERARSGATLTLAAVDDDDITWINGAEVGRTTGYAARREYRLPAGALHAGRNMVAVRVTDGGGGGGINGHVSLGFADGSRRALDGAWKFKVGAVSFHEDGQRINKIPTILYNKMVNPLLPFPIAGVIWYQGESNANNVAQAAAYREQFATLITSWRQTWSSGRGAFPFLWVQLPNFGPPDSAPPTDAAWAVQRESMSAALSLPNTGQAITIDIGDSANLHPRDKQDVGARLALVARRVAYHQPVVASGPTYRSHTVRGDTVIVDYSGASGGLTTRTPGQRVGGFAVAGSDRHFVWADAKIVRGRVYVWSDRVASPVAVRYAWANDPLRANLYNKERLPAAPFRTDRW
ncbi:MAG: sialate O-acetylesterase, partial [Gemmatimonadaceae bacterium]